MQKKRNVKSKKEKEKINENTLTPYNEEYYVENGKLIYEKLKEREWVLLIGGVGRKREYLVERLVADYVEENTLPILKHDKDFISQEDINMSYYKRINLKGYDSNRQEKFLLGHDIEKADIKLLTDGAPLMWLHKTGGGFFLYLFDNSNMFTYLDNLNCDNVALLHAFFESVFKSAEIQHCQLEYDPAKLPGHLIVSVKSEDFDRLPEEWWHMFYIVDFEPIAEKRERYKKRNTQNNDSQKAKPEETTLRYHINKGILEYGGQASKPLSPKPNHEFRKKAEVIMKYWKRRESCPMEELIIGREFENTKNKKQEIYDFRSKFSRALKEINLHMPRAINGKYPRPESPTDFGFIKDKKEFY